MPEAFDAYHHWLGISPKDQPPNHYRLLGIEVFEDNLDVITSAADKQMAHLRTFQTGQHSAVSQKLLNAVATAKVCLLNPEKKTAYDQSLRQKLLRRSSPRPNPCSTLPQQGLPRFSRRGSQAPRRPPRRDGGRNLNPSPRP